MVKTEQPKPAKLELWDDYGSPAERIAAKDPRWTWKGEWTTREGRGRSQTESKMSAAKGAEASVTFDGTGAILVGPFLLTGGKADIYSRHLNTRLSASGGPMDGKLDRRVDVYPDEESAKFGEAVWHAFGLKPGQHALRVVVRSEPYPGSKGADFQIDESSFSGSPRPPLIRCASGLH